MIPTQDTDHATEAVALLISRYRDQKVVGGLAKVIGLKVQEVENRIFDFLMKIQLVNHPLGGGPWDVLDKIGALVGEARNSRADADYLPAIRLRIRANRSRGLAEDIIQLSNLIAPGATYYQWPPAAWEVDAFDITAAVASALKAFLGPAAAAGTSGQLRSSEIVLADLVVWGDSTAPGGGTGFTDSTAPTAVPALASLEVIV